MTTRAARVNFDWPDANGVLEKLGEELSEFREAMAAGDRDRQRHEIGDLLFTVANLSRHCGIDPEQALIDCNGRFRERFHRMEALLLEQGTPLAEATADQMESMWERAKSEERTHRGADSFLAPRRKG
jgi:ATP diphosphatase